MFKPIHLLLSILVLYSVYLNNNILKFLNSYIYASDVLLEEEMLNTLLSNWLYIIPIIIIVMFLLMIGIMYRKNKPILFYFVGICSFIVVIIINVYTVNFFNILIDNVVSIKTIKLIHDFVLIKMIIESIAFLFLFVRGIGLDFKKFDFNSDISKIEISESDKEEFEFNINIDFNEKKRKRKEKLRNIKYLYIENKFLINIFIIIFLVITAILIIFYINKNNSINKEGSYYSANSFVFKVNSTTLLNTDYQGKQLTDNYLLIVDTNIKSNYVSNSLYLNDFSLKIENIVFKPVKKYFDSLIDLGTFYDEEILPLEYTDYLFVYEIPEKYVNSEMYFRYNNKGNIIQVLLQPKKLNYTESSKVLNMNEVLEFDGALKGVNFKINNFDLSNKFLIEYNYCIKENDCILSKEYLKPTIDENYDKVVLKLDVEYNSLSDLDVDSFYKLLSKFGVVMYKVDDVWYTSYKFEEIKSNRVLINDSVYIGINSNIINAESIKFVFDIRGLKYEYVLK